MESNNTNNITSNDSSASSTSPPPLSERLLIFLIYFTFAVVAIALHVIVSLAIIRLVLQRGKFHSFHVLSMHLYFVDTVTFFMYAFYGCPSILLSYKIYGVLGDKVMGTLQTAGFLASVTIIFCISINRAAAIWQHRWNKRVCRSMNCFAFGLAAWLLGLLSMVFNYYVDCYTTLFEKMYIFKTVCTSGMTPQLFTPSAVAIYVGVYGVGVVYVYAACGLYKRYSGVELAQVQRTARGHKTRLLVQAFCIWLSLVANVLATRIVNTAIMPSKWAVVGAALVAFWSRTVAPICMLIFERDVRSRVLAMFGRKINGITQVTPVQRVT